MRRALEKSKKAPHLSMRAFIYDAGEMLDDISPALLSD